MSLPISDWFADRQPSLDGQCNRHVDRSAEGNRWHRVQNVDVEIVEELKLKKEMFWDLLRDWKIKEN